MPRANREGAEFARPSRLDRLTLTPDPLLRPRRQHSPFQSAPPTKTQRFPLNQLPALMHFYDALRSSARHSVRAIDKSVNAVEPHD